MDWRLGSSNLLLYDWLFRPVVYGEVCGGLVFLCWMTVRWRMRVAFQSDSGSGEAEASWGNSAEKFLNSCMGCLGGSFRLFHPKASVFYPNFWRIHRKVSVSGPKFWVICPKPWLFHPRLWLTNRKAWLLCRTIWLFSPKAGVGAPDGWAGRTREPLIKSR